MLPYIPRCALDITARAYDGKFLMWALLPDPDQSDEDGEWRPARFVWHLVAIRDNKKALEVRRQAIRDAWPKKGKSHV